MIRSPEQIAADDALTAAIEAVHHAYHGDGVEGMLVTYLVLAQRQYVDDENDAVIEDYASPRDNYVPIAHQIGMLEMHGARLRAQIAEHIRRED